MAHFKITKQDGTSYAVDCSLIHAQHLLKEEGEGASIQMIHPGTSGHGTAGIDY